MIKQKLIILWLLSFPITSVIAQPDIFIPDRFTSVPYVVVYDSLDYIAKELESYVAWQILSTETFYPLGNLGFEKGSCTDYASSRRPELFMSKKGKRIITGNAKERLWKADRLWMKTSQKPKKWSIAVFSPGADEASEYGHVAYVEEVGANGVIVVSDMNYKWAYLLTRRTVRADVADWYIY